MHVSTARCLLIAYSYRCIINRRSDGSVPTPPPFHMSSARLLFFHPNIRPLPEFLSFSSIAGFAPAHKPASSALASIPLHPQPIPPFSSAAPAADRTGISHIPAVSRVRPEVCGFPGSRVLKPVSSSSPPPHNPVSAVLYNNPVRPARRPQGGVL